MKNSIKKVLKPFFNSRAAGIYILLFAFVIGLATFIENDFGTSAAQKIIFKAWWFELLLLLFAISIVVNIFKFRMIPQKKWSLLMFHLSFIIILLGAGITRYFSFEGVMHIREGEASNTFLSSENYLQFRVLKEGKNYEFDEKVLFASLGDNTIDKNYLLGNSILNVKVLEVIPNPIQSVERIETGIPTLKIVLAGMEGRLEYYVKEGEQITINGLVFNFTNEIIPEAFNISRVGEELYFIADRAYTQMTMATQQLDTILPTGKGIPLKLKSLYSDGQNRFVFGDYFKGGDAKISSEKRKIESASILGIKVKVEFNGKTTEQYITGQAGVQGNPLIFDLDSTKFSLAYGAKVMDVPFSIQLNDFIMDRYPGTNSAASYASEVTLIDTRSNTNFNYRIFMNTILNYSGYRFFQSSYDQDEAGTYLSVNHDFWGTWISYTGYILLTIGLGWTLISKKTRFYQLVRLIKEIRMKKSALLIIFLFLINSIVFAQSEVKPKIESVSIEHAKLFSEVVVQDVNGRMKPMHTLTRELLRKISGKETFNDLNADQVVLSMFASKEEWFAEPLIKIGPFTKSILNKTESKISFKEFFTEDGQYLLQEDVKKAFDAKPIDRGQLEKELLKVDERINIVGMIFSGSAFRVIPILNDPNHTWTATQGHNHNESENSESVQLANSFFAQYESVLHEAMHSNNYSECNKLLIELSAYQKLQSSEVIPSNLKLQTEILLNNLDVFGRLAFIYLFLGIVLLILLFMSVFSSNTRVLGVFKIISMLVIAGFAFHTVGLAMRWYISGRAPWSNGYESLIYIAWTTTLAGLLFTRKSIGGITATIILAATVLLIAKLSYLDPEITPLVPVLNSYWLTIHVSLEAGSYGFLMLGAIIGLINLILMMFINQKNKERMIINITEMTYLSEITLIGGIAMLSVGTYLGGVWANESWGRYWGWDAKETWALVSILVYAFILHMRIIPKLSGIYLFNLATLFGLSSIVMTYFGVNYYLSGLHSYAAGDPIPVPTWVYVLSISFVIIAIVSYYKKKKLKLKV